MAAPLTPYAKAWLYAVRLRGRPGWQWEVSDLGQEAYRDTLTRAGLVVEDVDVVQDYPIHHDRLEPIGTFGFVTKRWRQWLYDTVAGCWRAANEAITPPPGTPVRVENVSIEFSEFGWLPVTLRAGGQEVTFEASDVYDPFLDLIAWLEAVAAGDFARLSINTEDVYVEFHVFPAESPLVRFLVWGDARDVRGDEGVELDVLVDRQSLVRAIYSTFIAFWEGEQLQAAWDHWNNGRHMPEDEWDHPYRLRSERLDRLISGEG